ncbi:hypothetical protein HYH03_010155 [Edaphochlamys debaryana]|uniref:Protein kinase domain-containing protein n=1 Tax=Edaphochlamys debaryana TaxID=47281 RepID=A0A835XYY4_9CHLO|nr:hypothetical protein HYH03_010155 [Edaphochlamys debaryana]|eukprot:KAG2491588.1 hypothetical protein HYH03_010155 [Edaphochlamys debaryana]
MTAPIPWFDRYVRDVDAALAAKPPAAELDRPPASPLAAATDAPSGQSSTAAGADHMATVAIAAGVAAGGVAAACALGLGLFVWIRRRRRAAASRNSSDAGSMFTKITLGPPQGSPAATVKLTTPGESGEGNECAASMAPRTESSTSAEVRIVRPSSLTSASGTHVAGYSDGSGSTPRDQSLPIEPAKPGVSRASAVLESANCLITEGTPYRSGIEVTFQLQVSGAEPEAGHQAPQHAPTDGYLPAPIPIVRLTPQVLGKGGFGRVFAGEMGDQPVAVKLIAEDLDKLPSSEAALVAKSFEQELEVLARCTHPCIVRVLAACAKPPRPCIVMERMETSLERMLYGGPDALLPLPVVIHIALEVARGLEYLHPTVLHRELKPGNVLINNPDSPKPVVKITDPLRRPAAAELVKRLLVIQQDLHRAAAELHKRLLPSALDPPALGASGGAAAQPPAGARAEATNAATMSEGSSASGLTDNLGSKSGCAGRKASAAESGAALGSGRSRLCAQQAAAAAQLQAFARGLLAMTQHPVITSRAARQVESIPEVEEEHELREAD